MITLKNILLRINTSILLSVCFFQMVSGQTEVGVSYELRDEEPQNGLGLRVETPLLSQLPVLNLSIRAHISYFSDENELTQQGLRYSEDITNYDLGIQGIVGINVGLVEPYVGFGIGSERINITPKALQPFNFDNGIYDLLLSEKSDGNMYWNASFGAKVSVVPILKPFVEYRYTNTELGTPKFDQFDTKTGRMVFGLSIRF